jgi:hypothetical protein
MSKYIYRKEPTKMNRVQRDISDFFDGRAEELPSIEKYKDAYIDERIRYQERLQNAANRKVGPIGKSIGIGAGIGAGLGTLMATNRAGLIRGVLKGSLAGGAAGTLLYAGRKGSVSRAKKKLKIFDPNNIDERRMKADYRADIFKVPYREGYEEAHEN